MLQPIKILHVIRPAEGGMKEHLLSLLKGLDKNRFHIHVACPGNSSIETELRKLGIQVHNIPLVGPINPGEDIRSCKAIKNLCQAEGFTIIHCHGSKAGLVGRLAAATAKVPLVILTAHNFVVDDKYSLAKKIVFTKGEQFLGRVTDCVITVSSALRKEYIEKFRVPAEKVVCVYNGIDTESFDLTVDKKKIKTQLGLAPEKPVIGTVARMAPQKGLPFLLEAIAILGETVNAGFLIAGDGPLRPDLERQAEQLGLSGKVCFPGYCQNIKEILQIFDIFVIPSISEGLSITAIEALAAGKPVVASRVGGLPEVVEDGKTGVLVPPGDPATLASAIKNLLDDPALRERMGRAGRRTAKDKFSLENMIRKTEELYISLFKGLQVK